MALNRIERYVIKLEADDTQDVVEGTFMDVFRDTAHAILDRHDAFFALLRNEKLIGSGVTRTGQPIPKIPGTQWSRIDRWLDLQNSDILHIEGERETIMWSGISLSASAAEGEASSAQIRFERSESAAIRARRNTRKISRKAVIAKMLKSGVRPGQNWPWKKFCDAVRDAANGWERGSGGTFNRGFSDRSITRDTLALMRLLDT